MATRPIDIARKLNVSTTTLRNYEELGLIPPVSRSASGYRVFTEEVLHKCLSPLTVSYRNAPKAKMIDCCW